MEEVFGSEGESTPPPRRSPSPVSEAADEDLFGSDGEEVPANNAEEVPATNAEKEQEDEEEDLFGSDDDNEQQQPSAVSARPGRLSPEGDSQREELDGLFGSDDEAPQAQTKIRQTHSELSLPVLKKILIPKSTTGLCTMPNFLKIQTHPYDPEHHFPEDEEKKFKSAIDMIRWRYKTDGSGSLVLDTQGRPVRESNARMVKWSDGSLQMVVGSTVFNIDTVHIPDSYGYAQLKNGLQEADSTGSGDRVEDTKASRRPQPSCLHCVGKIENKIQILPSSVNSDAHARMSLQVAEKYNSGSANRQIGYKHIDEIKVDPEKEMQLRIAAEEAELRKERKRKLMENQTGYPNKKKYSAMSARYLEENIESEGAYDSTSLSAIKRRNRGVDDYNSEEYSGDETDQRRGGQSRQRGRNEYAGEMDGFIVDDEEDGDEEYEEHEVAPRSRLQKKNQKRNVDSDGEPIESDEASFQGDEDGSGSDDEVPVVDSAITKSNVRSKRIIEDSDDD